jgi:uncharacterized membrane protein
MGSRFPGMALVTRPFAQVSALDEIARADAHNVANWERIASIAVGGALGAAAVLTRSKVALAAGLGLLGGAFIYRGSTGKCELYRQLGVNTAQRHLERGVPDNRGINVEAIEHIDKPAEELFHYWRDLSNLPSFMQHVISVEEAAGGISHWKVRGPMNSEVEWDSEIIEEQPGRMLAWRTLPGANVASAGSVWFEPEGGGSRVKVSLQYDPPAGAAGATVASMLGTDPKKLIVEDLGRFKQMMEA